MSNRALFDIDGDGEDSGFVGTALATHSFTLRSAGAGVHTWQLQVFDPTAYEPTLPIVGNPPRKSKGAPNLTLQAGSSGSMVTAESPGSPISSTMPSGTHSWLVRSIVNGGMSGTPPRIDPELIHERLLVLAPTGLRKPVVTELRQYEEDSWAGAIADLVDALASVEVGAGGPTPGVYYARVTSPAPGTEDGSPVSPFATIAAAVAAAVADDIDTIILLPGDLGGAEDPIVLTSAVSLNFAALTPNHQHATRNSSDAHIPTLEYNGPVPSGTYDVPTLTFTNVAVGNLNTTGFLAFNQCLNVTVSTGLAAGNPIRARAVRATHSVVGPVAADLIHLRDCEILSDAEFVTSDNELRLDNCYPNGPVTITFVGDSGIVRTDPTTHARLQDGGISLVNCELVVEPPHLPLNPVEGALAYFDGTAWVELPPGDEGDSVRVVGGVPAWQATGFGAFGRLPNTNSPIFLANFETDINDYSGNGHHLSIDTGALRFTDIVPGFRALLFSGLRLVGPASAVLRTLGDVTIQQILQFDSAPSTNFYLTHAANLETEVGNEAYGVFFSPAPFVPTWRHESGVGVDREYSPANIAMPPVHNLMHFAARRAANVIQFFLNGRPIGAASSALVAPTGGTDGRLYVGGFPGTTAPTHLCAGAKINHAALTNQQIADDYNASLGIVYGVYTP